MDEKEGCAVALGAGRTCRMGNKYLQILGLKGTCIQYMMVSIVKRQGTQLKTSEGPEWTISAKQMINKHMEMMLNLISHYCVVTKSCLTLLQPQVL